MGRIRRTATTRLKMKSTNVIYEAEHIGLEAITVLDNKPYFFLFMELDTKDEEDLRTVLDFYRKRNLAFLWYESTKGWHVISARMGFSQARAFRIESKLLSSFGDKN